jgi:hypothetical protein
MFRVSKSLVFIVFCLFLMLFTGCESLFYVDPEVIVGGSFIGGADKDIRSDDAFFIFKKQMRMICYG